MVDNNFNSNKNDLNAIYCLHGSINNLPNTVITTEDYIRAYYNDSDLREYLKYLFNEYTIIFIGTSIGEFPILEHLIKGTKQHYALIGCYLNDVNIFRLNINYYESINMARLRFEWLNIEAIAIQ